VTAINAVFETIYSKTTTDGQRLHHDFVHFVVDDMSGFSEVHRVDDWEVAIVSRKDDIKKRQLS
jgi:hypothetical protein